jgi:uncharacterized protein YutE (UPF0331/DUF86 family)
VTNAQLVSRKLAALVEFSKRARRRRPASVQVLENDTELQDALGMALLVAIQETIDIAFHIVTDERWGTPHSYADGFEMLAKGGVIGPDLAQAMTRAAGLRKRLAHGYASVNVQRLWAELPQGLDALDDYARAIAQISSRNVETPG